MRGVSLSLNMIILIALGLLVLVIAAMIIIKRGGSFSRAMGAQMSMEECKALCASIQSKISSLGEITDCGSIASLIPSELSEYCSRGCNGTYTCIIEIEGKMCSINRSCEITGLPVEINAINEYTSMLRLGILSRPKSLRV